jgi:hypothetical protein
MQFMAEADESTTGPASFIAVTQTERYSSISTCETRKPVGAG